jgi:DNA-binding CsgD family transcriptional regulator
VLSSPPPPESRTLHEATSAVDYFARVSEIVRDFDAALDPIRAVELLEEATLRMGAEVAVFASFIRDDDRCESYRLLLACDPQWCVEYEQLARFTDDPWLNYARHHSEPVRGSEIETESSTERALVELAERFGFRSSVVVPAPSSAGLSRLGVLCLGSSWPGYFEADGYVEFKVVARSVAMELHEWWIARLKDDLILAAQLTESDLALLAHERQGHGTKAIARLLGTSTGAIDSRFQRIIAKLGVPNRKAAARLAAEYGLI